MTVKKDKFDSYRDGRYPNKPLLTLLPITKRENGQNAYAIRLNIAAIKALNLDNSGYNIALIPDYNGDKFPLVIATVKSGRFANLRSAKFLNKKGLFTSMTMYLLICKVFNLSATQIPSMGYDIFFGQEVEPNAYSLGGSVDLDNINVVLSGRPYSY